MSDDLEARGHHAITHDDETYIKLADASVTFSLYRKDIAAKDAEITRLRAKVDAVYSERNRLAAAFARMALAAGFRAGKGVDPDETKWPVVYVDTPNGQVSWHIAESDQGALEGLLARVLEGTGPDRELDFAIAAAFGWPDSPNLHQHARRYTESLDAALTLVPKGWDWARNPGVDKILVSLSIDIPLPDGTFKSEWISQTHTDDKRALIAVCIKARMEAQGD